MNDVHLVVMTDGRGSCISQTIPRVLSMLHGVSLSLVIHDDSGDTDYHSWLAEEFEAFDVIGTLGRQGFGGAIRNLWTYLAGTAGPRWIFHLEDDFLIERPVDLAAIIAVLEPRPYLVQMALRRQSWNDEERAAGGIVESHPADYTDWFDDAEWLEHRRFFTTNPSLYSRQLCARGWPPGGNSEGRFTHRLLADPDVRFGFWGSRSEPPWVEHIGNDRIGVGY